MWFYRKQHLATKLTALYKGEAIKFVLTVVLLVFHLNTFRLQILLFFLVVFIALMLNNLVPFLLRGDFYTCTKGLLCLDNNIRIH